MAKKAESTTVVLDAVEIPEEFKKLSLEEIQKMLAVTDLKARLLDLDRIEDDTQRRTARKEAMRKHNEQVQLTVNEDQRRLDYIQSVCRHKQGGRPQNVFAGDGKPCVVKTQMLDGYTFLLQCSRCRLKVFTPHPSLKRTDPEEYLRQKALYDKMLELNDASGLDEIRGPTFTFERDGTPFIPERR